MSIVHNAQNTNNIWILATKRESVINTETMDAFPYNIWILRICWQCTKTVVYFLCQIDIRAFLGKVLVNMKCFQCEKCRTIGCYCFCLLEHRWIGNENYYNMKTMSCLRNKKNQDYEGNYIFFINLGKNNRGTWLWKCMLVRMISII